MRIFCRVRCVRCKLCQAISDPVTQQFKYTQPIKCKNPTCVNRTEWTLRHDTSKFVDWQRGKDAHHRRHPHTRRARSRRALSLVCIASIGCVRSPRAGERRRDATGVHAAHS